MLKKTMNFIMIYALLVTGVYSQTTNLKQQSLHRIFDHMSYNLEVLWDQNDTNFYRQTINNFKRALEYEKKNGLTAKDLMTFVESKIVDPTAREEFRRISGQLYDSVTMEEAQEILADYKSNMRESGTNWLGGGRKGKRGMILLCFLVFVAIGIGIWALLDDGRDGEDGRDGQNGQNGQDGRDGENGQDGIDGENGQDGRDGEDGQDGRDGRNGQDGRDGENGHYYGCDDYMTMNWEQKVSWTNSDWDMYDQCNGYYAQVD